MERSRVYDTRIRAGTVRWAMRDMVENPPAGFEDIVRTHFYLQKRTLLAMCTDCFLPWPAEPISTLNSGHDSSHWRLETLNLTDVLNSPDWPVKELLTAL